MFLNSQSSPIYVMFGLKFGKKSQINRWQYDAESYAIITKAQAFGKFFPLYNFSFSFLHWNHNPVWWQAKTTASQKYGTMRIFFWEAGHWVRGCTSYFWPLAHGWWSHVWWCQLFHRQKALLFFLYSSCPHTIYSFLISEALVSIYGFNLLLNYSNVLP